MRSATEWDASRMRRREKSSRRRRSAPSCRGLLLAAFLAAAPLGRLFLRDRPGRSSGFFLRCLFRHRFLRRPLFARSLFRRRSLLRSRLLRRGLLGGRFLRYRSLLHGGLFRSAFLGCDLLWGLLRGLLGSHLLARLFSGGLLHRWLLF